MRAMRFFVFCVLFCVTAASLQAAIIANFTDQLTLADPTMTGRIFRDGAPSTWGTTKLFPGTSGATARTFNTYTYDIGIRRFIQVSIDDPLVGVFTAAYHTSFTPAPGPTSTNYLGDAGSSGNPFGNPNFFQVEVPVGKDLVLMVSSALQLTGPGAEYGILVEGFLDANYSDVPEPGTAALTAGALGVLAMVARARRNRQ